MKSGFLSLAVFAACANALVARSLVSHCDDISFTLTSLNRADPISLADQKLTPTTPCVIEILPTMGPVEQPTCTFYAKTATTVSYTDCRGCLLNTMWIGLGPEVICGVTTMAPQTVTTITSCSPSAAY